jgi:hypothetical protein
MFDRLNELFTPNLKSYEEIFTLVLDGRSEPDRQ